MSALAPPQPADGAARIERLRDPLLAELGRPRRAAPPRRTRVVAVVALAAVLGVVGALVPRGGPEPALAVERADGWLELRIVDVSASAETLTHELRAAGVPGEVRLLAVAPDEVGTWAVISEHGVAPGVERGPGDPPTSSTVRLDRVMNDGRTLRMPIAEVRETTGYFIFYVGREARPGEELKRDGPRRYAP